VYTVSDFIDELNCESWDFIFNSEGVNVIFNSFLNIYSRIFYSSFPLKKKVINRKNIVTAGSLQALEHHVDIRGNCTAYTEIVIIWN
jgi:hypothetical protein